jgi:hypothetical protein
MPMFPQNKTKALKLAKSFDRAARAIQQHGWTQGQYGSEDEGFCLVGACVLTGPIIGMSTVLGHLIAGYPGMATPVYWNDQQCQSSQEAQEMLLAAASAAMSDAEVLK